MLQDPTNDGALFDSSDETQGSAAAFGALEAVDVEATTHQVCPAVVGPGRKPASAQAAATGTGLAFGTTRLRRLAFGASTPW